MSGSGISWAICKSASRSRQITTPAPHHSVFYRLDALPATQPTASKHWRQDVFIKSINILHIKAHLSWTVVIVVITTATVETCPCPNYFSLLLSLFSIYPRSMLEWDSQHTLVQCSLYLGVSWWISMRINGWSSLLGVSVWVPFHNLTAGWRTSIAFTQRLSFRIIWG